MSHLNFEKLMQPNRKSDFNLKARQQEKFLQTNIKIEKILSKILNTQISD